MSQNQKLAMICELLITAKSSLDSATQMLGAITGQTIHIDNAEYAKKASLITDSHNSNRIVEGVFNGQNMVDENNNTYPVPANYASKSKLVPGDVLKLTITDEGKFIYKQIGPIDRKHVVGPLIKDNGQYKVLTKDKAYKVLLASVTYFQADVGDEITIIVPAEGESEWAAIEAVLPRFDENSETKLTDMEDISSSKGKKKTKAIKKEINLEEDDELGF